MNKLKACSRHNQQVQEKTKMHWIIAEKIFTRAQKLMKRRTASKEN